jgi:cobalamin synthase
MALGRELRAAAELATLRPSPARPLAELASALAWLPLFGLAIGAIAVAMVTLVGRLGPAVLASAAAVGVLIIFGRRALPLGLGLVASLVTLGALAFLAPYARVPALLVAPMLARWAVVVQCYGGAPQPQATGLAALVGRARFREFGIASVAALGVTLALLDAVGLVVAVASALVTLGVRVAAYRWAGGLSAGALNATSALVETSALVLFCGFGMLLGR